MNRLIRYGAIAIGAAMMSSCGGSPQEGSDLAAGAMSPVNRRMALTGPDR